MSKKEINENLSQIIKSAMDENDGKIELQDAKELIRPYFVYDNDKLIDNALTVKTRYIIYSLRDKKGVRICFADDSGTYMDISKPLSDDEYEKIEKQLREKAVGAMKAWRKILRTRNKDIAGQISFDELDNFIIYYEKQA